MPWFFNGNVISGIRVGEAYIVIHFGECSRLLQSCEGTISGIFLSRLAALVRTTSENSFLSLTETRGLLQTVGKSLPSREET